MNGTHIAAIGNGGSIPSPSRYDALDSLRGLAAMLVAAYHFNPAASSLLGSFLGNAYLFVDFFFVLSGFVIAHSYAARLVGAGDVKRFAIRRIARLYPLHLFVLGIYVAIEGLRFFTSGTGDREPFAGIRSLWSLLANVAMVQGMGTVDKLTWNGVSWSISAELWTYLLFALLVIWSGRFRLLAFFAAGAVGMLVLLLRAPDTMNVSFDFGFARCVAGFFAGALLQGVFFSDHTTGDRIGGSGATALEFVAVAGCIAFVAVAGDSRLSLAAPIVFVGVVAVFARADGAISRGLANPTLMRIGVLSYAVYMIHPILVYLSFSAARVVEHRSGLALTAPFAEDGQIYTIFHLPAPILMDAATIAFVVVVVLISIPINRLVEVPSRRLLESRFLGAPSAAGAESRRLSSSRAEAIFLGEAK